MSMIKPLYPAHKTIHLVLIEIKGLEKKSKRTKNYIDKRYDNAKETKRYVVNGNRYLFFTKYFLYLGFWIPYGN